MDVKNSPSKHITVGIFSLALVLALHFLLDVEWIVALARTAFTLLFLTLLIGPLVMIKVPSKTIIPTIRPWSWRGELGIWFTITALAHFILLLFERPLTQLIRIGGSGYSLTNFIGLVALVIAVVLSFASFGKVIRFLGVQSWRVLHSLTYVIFYLVAAHIIYFQFFSSFGDVGPDWYGWLSVSMVVVIIVLQIIAFTKTVSRQNKAKSENKNEE